MQSKNSQGSDVVQTNHDAGFGGKSQPHSTLAGAIVDDSHQYLISDPERLAEKRMRAISKRLQAKNYVHQQNMLPQKAGAQSVALQSQLDSVQASGFGTPAKGAGLQTGPPASVRSKPGSVTRLQEQQHLDDHLAKVYEKSRIALLNYADPSKGPSTSQQIMMNNAHLDGRLNQDLDF